ncbi:MAG: TolC family protein [Candidatus Margulisiibacteriota bacterium]
MRKFVLAFILLLFILCANGLALTWDEAVNLAAKNSNELISAQKGLESTEWSYKRAFSTFLPQLSASASLSNSQSGTTAAWSESYSYGLSASQSLFRGTEGIYSIQSAYANVEYEKASLQSTKASVLYDLRSAFITVLIAQENVKLLEKILDQRKSNAQLIQLRYDSGKEDKGNLMGTNADEAGAKYDLSSAKRDLKLARLKLSQLLGVEIDNVEGQNGVRAPAEVKIDEMIPQTPSYIMYQKQLESSELAYKATISGFLPSVSLSGSLRNTGSDWPPDSTNKSWSLNFSYPFFPGGSNVADRASYAARLDAAREDFKQSIKDLKYSLEQSYEDLNDSLEALEVAKVSLAADEERAKIARVKYLNGLTNYDEWDRIESSYIQAQKSLLNYKKSAMSAEALWHKTYGGYVK